MTTYNYIFTFLFFCASKRNGYGPLQPTERTTSVPVQTLAPGLGQRDCLNVAPSGEAQSSQPVFRSHLTPTQTYHQREYSSLQRNHNSQNQPINPNQVQIVANNQTGVHMGSLPERGRLSNRNPSQLISNSRLGNNQQSVIPQSNYISKSSSAMRQSLDQRTVSSTNGDLSRAAPSAQNTAVVPPAHNRSSIHDTHSKRLNNDPTTDSTVNPPPIVPRRQKKHPERLVAPHKSHKNQHVSNNSRDRSQMDKNLANHLLVKDSQVIGNNGVLYTVASTPL